MLFNIPKLPKTSSLQPLKTTRFYQSGPGSKSDIEFLLNLHVITTIDYCLATRIVCELMAQKSVRRHWNGGGMKAE